MAAEEKPAEARPKASRALPEPAPPPPWYEATADLTVGHPDSGVVPARAFGPGDRVPPELVEANGWGANVRVPDRFKGAAPPPHPPAPADDASAT